MTHGGTYAGVAQGSSCRPGPQSELHSPAAVAPAYPVAPAQALFSSRKDQKRLRFSAIIPGAS